MILADLPPPSAWMNDKGFVISARGFKDFGQFDKSQPYHIPLYTLDAFEGWRRVGCDCPMMHTEKCKNAPQA